MHIFYSNCKAPELSTYCSREGISLADILAEMKKSKKEKRKRDFERIINVIRVDKKKYTLGIVDKECAWNLGNS